jgi:tetratricopeptide (TPR) repeat protein
MRTLAALLLAAALPLSAQVAEGDRHYAARAEGAHGRVAAAAPIDAAIVAYRTAIAAAPNDLDAHWKLLRALRFQGAYVATSADEKKKVYGTAKTEGQKALAVVSRLLAARGVDAGKANEKAVANAARAIPGAAEVYLWDAINWGEWALAYGKLAAAREGAADRIRREATIAMLINPQLEAGAPARVLGRLHDQTPRIPFLTGWASSKEALRFLEESLALDPSNKLTTLFLAEALVSADSDNKRGAVQMLQKIVAAPDHPEYAVEDAAAVADAKALLAKWK